MAIQGIQQTQEALQYHEAQDTPPKLPPELLQHIFNQIVALHKRADVCLGPMLRLKLVCQQWASLARPWVLRISENFTHFETLRSLCPPLDSELAELQIQLEAAKAAGCLNTQKAMDILSQAKKKVPQLEKHGTQYQIDISAKILEIEISLDPIQGASGLADFRAFALRLHEPYHSYAWLRICQLETDIGAEGAEKRLASAAKVFSQIATLHREEIIKKKYSFIFEQSLTADDAFISLIKLAVLEILVFGKATETIRLTTEMHDSAGLDYGVIETIQCELSKNRVTNIPPETHIITLENLKEMKETVLASTSTNSLQMVHKGFNLILIARLEATFDRIAAWDTLQGVVQVVNALPTPIVGTSLVKALIEQTLSM